MPEVEEKKGIGPRGGEQSGWGRAEGLGQSTEMRPEEREGGWALRREEVICQIAFHSLLGL